MSLPTSLTRLAGPLREFGVGPGLLYIVDRLLRALSPRVGLYVYEFMVQPIGVKALLPANLAKSLTCAELTPDHPDVRHVAARPEILAQRFEQGARCLAVYRKGTFIGYMWFCRDRYHEDEARCTYVLADAPRSVFDFDFYVLPEHRMGIAFLGIWHCADQFLAAQGVRYSFSRLTRFNTASRRAHAHLGWKRAGQGVFLQVFGAELMLATLPPYVGFTTGTRRLTLALPPDALHGSVPAAASSSPSGTASP